MVGRGFRRSADLPLVRASPGAGPVIILLGVLVFPTGLAISGERGDYDTWGAFLWGPVILAAVFPLCRWVARRTGEPSIAGFLFAAAGLKIIGGSLARYFMVGSVYGSGDARKYDNEAAELVGQFREGVFDGLGKITGTRFIEVVTAIVQALIGETRLGTFLVFSAFAFLGMCLLYVAFCDALPGGDRTLFRRLLFLTPTLWFWPSSIGKEAFLVLCIGATALGYVRMLEGHLRGAPLTLLGLWGAIVVRPHIALMLILGAAAAFPPPLDGPADRPWAQRVQRPIGRMALPLAVLLALPLLLSSVERFFKIEDLNLETATEVREDVVRRTTKDGTDFSAPDSNDPLGLANGIVTVAFRPFPWEARGFRLIASLESAALAVISFVALMRRRGRLLTMFRQRWPRFALVYVVAFAWAFSAIANAGILARQRSLMLPFLFVLVAANQRVIRAPGRLARRDALPAVKSGHEPGVRVDGGPRP